MPLLSNHVFCLGTAFSGNGQLNGDDKDCVHQPNFLRLKLPSLPGYRLKPETGRGPKADKEHPKVQRLGILVYKF